MYNENNGRKMKAWLKNVCDYDNACFYNLQVNSTSKKSQKKKCGQIFKFRYLDDVEVFSIFSHTHEVNYILALVQ